MITESIRTLLYPLGYGAQLLFGLRFIVQWLHSESKGKSIVPKSFWLLSLLANIILAFHSYVQLQFPLFFLQTLSALMALRNLDLLRNKALSFSNALIIGSGILVFALFFFFAQADATWMRPPTKEITLPLFFHLLGMSGMVLFASRFWVQWWHAEQKKKSELRLSFWWMSLIGGSLSLLYFSYLHDFVNIIGYSLGLVPYTRNIRLLKRHHFDFVPKNTLFCLAAEKSGDQLGAALLKNLKNKLPTTNVIGVGGDAMAREGMKIFIPSNQFEVMGLTALFPAAFRLFRNFHKIKRLIIREKPKMVLLIDYAEFNMLLARALRKGGYRGKIVQYVIPSVWAWRKGRIHSLEKYYDLLLSILPFEADYFANKKVAVRYVGHPLTDLKWTQEKERSCLAIFPGSRAHEIEENLPVQLEAAKALALPLSISVASEKIRPRIEALADQAGISYKLVPAEERHTLMEEATVSLATSGTVILELALLQTPTVVVYKISYLNYLVGRYLFRIKLTHVSLPNILMGRKIFPEHVDKKVSSATLVRMVEEVMMRKEEIRKECIEMRHILEGHEKGDAAEELYALFMS